MPPRPESPFRFSPQFVRAITAGDEAAVRRHLASDDTLATTACGSGATRGSAKPHFIKEISHYIYEGDTALHIAAAAFKKPIAALLIAAGADCLAKNRRGAAPLHYAADTNHWDPAAQAETITYLIAVGSDPNGRNQDGVTPLHRAVRTRSSAAVAALLAGGADPRLTNRSGSTPLQLAQSTTGRGGSGSAQARAEQRRIVAILQRRL